MRLGKVAAPLLGAWWIVMASAAGAHGGVPLVAVIDSGVAATPELAPLLAGELDTGAPQPRPAFQPRYDHGTMVATILARAMEGQVSILSVRIDDPAGCPPGASPPCQPRAGPVADAIRRAAALRPAAINISLALADDQTIVDAVRDAAAQGIDVVMAAGNQGADHPANRRMAQAGGARAVLVGALDAHGDPWPGSNRPEALASYAYVWRPGVDVPTEALDGRPVTATGTSFAVPLETARRLQAARANEGAAAGLR